MGVTGSRRWAVLALVLLVPAPSVGAAMGLVIFPGTALGQTVYAASKLWILLLPLVWLFYVDVGRTSLSPTRLRNLIPGVILGAAISAIIFAGYWLLGNRLIDVEGFRAAIAEAGLDSKTRYLILVAYLTLLNSLLEEYVWRWFVFSKCEALVNGAAAVVLSALFFTIHHVIALAVYLPTATVVLCSTGVFVGGAAWSWCYLRYRSIWPGYVSHAIVDAAVFVIGWRLIFG